MYELIAAVAGAAVLIAVVVGLSRKASDKQPEEMRKRRADWARERLVKATKEMTCVELRDALRKKKMLVSGNKAVLIERLISSFK